jgi:hypothetical protein
MEISAFISSLRNSDLSNRNAEPTVTNVENLIYKVQPSVYFYSGTVKSYGEKPRNLFTDIQSLSGLNNPAILKNNIELVTIRINTANELNAAIDWSVFSAYKNLKYIYILSGVNTTSQNIARLAGNYSEKYSVFYKVDKGENNQ